MLSQQSPTEFARSRIISSTHSTSAYQSVHSRLCSYSSGLPLDRYSIPESIAYDPFDRSEIEQAVPMVSSTVNVRLQWLGTPLWSNISNICRLGCPIYGISNWCFLRHLPSSDVAEGTWPEEGAPCDTPQTGFDRWGKRGVAKKATRWKGWWWVSSCYFSVLYCTRSVLWHWGRFDLVVLFVKLSGCLLFFSRVSFARYWRFTSTAITDPEDPRFDLEKLIAKWESDS